MYLHREQVYNLLMKVDSNTYGSTYWFMFKVSNFTVGVKYKFRIYNFTRSLSKFYIEGKNVVTKREPLNGIKKRSSDDDKPTDSWKYNMCDNICFEQSEVVRGERRYYKLSFEYTFKEEDANSTVCFAYAKPYSYSKLIKDLHKVKTCLMEKIEDGEPPSIRMIPKDDSQETLTTLDVQKSSKRKLEVRRKVSSFINDPTDKKISKYDI